MTNKTRKRKKPRSWWINVYSASSVMGRTAFLHQRKKRAKQCLQPNGETIHVREVL